MESNEIYNKQVELISKIDNADEQAEMELIALQAECPHELALVFDDHFPHMTGPKHRYVCPACGKREDIYPTHEVEKSSFRNSTRIKLTDLDIINSGITDINNLYRPLFANMFANYDYYYRLGTPLEEIDASVREAINGVLKDFAPSKTINKPNHFLFKIPRKFNV